MTYLGLLHGAVGIQYFVRSQGVFPDPAAWGEIRMMAMEVRVLTPALTGGRPVHATVSDPSQCALNNCTSSVVVRAWADRDSSIVVVAANAATVASPACPVKYIPERLR